MQVDQKYGNGFCSFINHLKAVTHFGLSERSTCVSWPNGMWQQPGQAHLHEWPAACVASFKKAANPSELGKLVVVIMFISTSTADYVNI